MKAARTSASKKQDPLSPPARERPPQSPCKGEERVSGGTFNEAATKKRTVSGLGSVHRLLYLFYLSVHRNWYEALMMARLISLSSIISRGKPKVSAW